MQINASGATTEGAKDLLRLVAEQPICTGVLEPADGALSEYYGYYVSICDPKGECAFPSNLIVGSVGVKKDAHV